MKRLLLLVCLPALVLNLVRPVRASAFQPPPVADGVPVASAQRLFDEATALFDKGQYAEAATVFARLYIQTKDPAMLYPLAQSQRLAGQCAEALESYERFVGADEELRRRAESAAPGAGLKRLTNDLVYARGRIVEMRVCRARARLGAARQSSQRALAAGDAPAALAAMERVWTEDRDPTALGDLAQLHQARGECAAATRSLELAIDELTPVEPLKAAGTPGSDLAEALATLTRLRAQHRDLTCKSAMPQQKVPATSLASVAVVERPVRAERPASGLVRAERPLPAAGSSRWPLITAGVGAGLVAAGVGSLLMARRTQEKVNDHLMKTKGEWDAAGLDLVRQGNLYNGVGIGLTIGGGVVGGAALLYHFLRAPAEAVALTPQWQVAVGRSTLSFQARF